MQNLNRLAITKPKDGVLEIISCETDTVLILPLQDVDLLIHALSHLDQIGLVHETIYLDPPS
jgi:hypothetical protein